MQGKDIQVVWVLVDILHVEAVDLGVESEEGDDEHQAADDGRTLDQ